MAKDLRVALICAALEEKCKITLAVFCKCDLEEKSGSLPFGHGFPNGPWHCQKCGKVTEDSNDLLYEIEPIPGTCHIKIVDHFFCNDMVFEVAAYKEVNETERLITTCDNSFFVNQFEFINHDPNL